MGSTNWLYSRGARRNHRCDGNHNCNQNGSYHSCTHSRACIDCYYTVTVQPSFIWGLYVTSRPLYIHTYTIDFSQNIQPDTVGHKSLCISH
jgi:hypothetical protein